MIKKRLVTLGLAASLAVTSFSGVLSETVAVEAANQYYDTESVILNPEIIEINITENDCITRDELRYDLIEKYNYDIDKDGYASSIDVNKSSYGGSVVFAVVPSNEGFKFDKYYIKIKPFNMYYDLGKCDDLVVSDKDRKVFRFHFTSSDMEYWFGVSRYYNKNNNTWIYSDNLDISYQEYLDKSVVVKEIYNDKTVTLTKINYFDMLSKYNGKEWTWNRRDSFTKFKDGSGRLTLFQISKGSTSHYYLRYNFDDLDLETFYKIKFMPKKDSFYDYAKFTVNNKIINKKIETYLMNTPDNQDATDIDYANGFLPGYYLQNVFLDFGCYYGCLRYNDFYRDWIGVAAAMGSYRYKVKSLNKKVVVVKYNPEGQGKDYIHDPNAKMYNDFSFYFKSVGTAKIQFTDVITGKKWYIKFKIGKKLKKKDYMKDVNHGGGVHKSGSIIYGWLK